MTDILLNIRHCKQCDSHWTSHDVGKQIRFSCGSSCVVVNGEEVWSHACSVDDEPICHNCGSVKCMHFVFRHWEEVDSCDGWCCPDCRPVAHDEPLPENWRDLPATPRND